MSKATIKASVVEFAEVYMDFDRNFRDPAKDYVDCNPTPGFDREKYEQGLTGAGFFEDIMMNGIQTPIVVVPLTRIEIDNLFSKTQKHYKYRGVKGHRRMWTAGLVNEKFPDTIVEVNALVYEGLTTMEEWALLTDHSDVRREKELSGAGVYRAVIKLHGAGFSQEQTAIMLGKTGRGFAQRHVNVFAMRNSTPVEKHWLGIHLSKDDPDRPAGCLRLTNKNIDDLMPAFNADKSANRDPMALNSEFRKEWDKIGATGKSTNDSAPKAFKREDILARQTFTEGRPALTQALDFAANNGGSIETAVAMYDRLADKAAKFDALTIENDRLKGEIYSLTTEVEALKAEIASLKTPTKKPVKS